MGVRNRETSDSKREDRSSVLAGVVKILIPILILTIGIASASYIYKTAPKAGKKAPVRMDPVVKTMQARCTTEQVIVRAMGTVAPAKELVLESRVSGEVIDVYPEFIEGGILGAGENIIKIDPEDYKLLVAQKESEVANARYEMKLELGHQDVAKREWELLKGDKPPEELELELALRKPHLEKAKAKVAAARAELKKAKLDLERTNIRVPFNAIVRSKDVELGSQASAQKILAELVGTDAYWVLASIPVDRLKWISIPRNTGDKGANVRVSFGNGFEKKGTVIKLLSDLETEGRMARILIEIKDPLGLKNAGENDHPLLIGEYVRVEIEGEKLVDVISIPRSVLRDNDKIWVVEKGDTLDIRDINIVWRDSETVLLKDCINDGDMLVISEIAAPVQGMRVRVNRQESGT